MLTILIILVVLMVASTIGIVAGLIMAILSDKVEILFPTMVVVGLIVAGMIFLGANSSDDESGREVEVPVIKGEIYQSLFSGMPLARFYEKDGVYYARLTDAVTAKEGKDSDKTQNIRFEVTNENAKLKKADFTLAIYLRGQVLKQKGNGELVLSGSDLAYGELEYEVVAKNTAGEIRKKLIVTKYHMKEACEQFDPENREKICQGYVEKAKEDEERRRREEEKEQQEQNKVPSSGPICLNYQSGECWDDVENAGYDDGYDDGWMGMRYGASFFDSLPAGFGSCIGLCEDIYEDAYSEGYADGRWEARDEF